MSFTTVYYDTWERREYFEFFKDTTIYMTVQMDITTLYRNLKQRGLRIYPALVYCTAFVINRFPEFRYAYDEQRNIVIWDIVHPYYTVPRKENRELFSIKKTTFSQDFQTFYSDFLSDYAAAENSKKLQADDELPENICGVSIVPGTHYSAFSFSGEPKSDFTPFTMFGKFIIRDEQILLPVSGEFSHAVNDGIHASRFFNEFESAANNLFN